MEKVHAVVKDGVVVNMIVIDTSLPYEGDFGGEVVSISESVGIGWFYNGSVFTAPPEPEKTVDQIIHEQELQKEGLINAANAFMNNKQWPGKAALGRLKGIELSQYNSWLDYLDELDALDSSMAYGLTWPESPSM